ncbi:hypothetical protein [Maridesulfovibrio zosterae]|uniref:hypothetical protein n=1 Tax=Maridesulfovibrio zosterae TaxID=82171 RepID=UPI00040497AD|nr:hypothetical protein [Maridesulfovibrio zosterae]
MLELVTILISFIVFAFIIYSTFSARNSKFAQKKKAFELKQAHMNKSMEMLRSEIQLIETEIQNTKSKFN